MSTLEGGSVGLQLGGEATDLVLLVVNHRGVDALLKSKVKLGGCVVAARPKGRRVAASTDASLRAEILSYSRSRGLFAGMSLEGTTLRTTTPTSRSGAQNHGTTHRDWNQYRCAGRRPAAVDVLQKSVPRNESKKMTSR